MRTEMVEPDQGQETRTAGARPPGPARGPGRQPGPRSSAGDVVLAYLDDQAARLRSLEPAVRGGEPDSVHQMRTTTRRLRDTLRAYRTVLAGPVTQQLSDELKWLGGVLGEARDGEVLSELLRDELASAPPELVLGAAQARIRMHFAPRQAAAQRAVLAALDSARYSALLRELGALIDDPPLTVAAARPAARVLRKSAERQYRRTRRRMRRARRLPAGPARDAALHEPRKAARRARYAAEAVQPVFGRKSRRFARRMRAIQSTLGAHHDAVNVGAVAREIGVQAHLAGENAFSFGLLAARARCAALEHEDQARQAWKRVSRARPRRWTG
jgi:CHAD domain-containing protein